MKNKYLIITVDTEVDWFSKKTNNLSNVLPAIDIIQETCQRYSYLPSYLCTYEVVADPKIASKLNSLVASGKCEVGSHLHIWSTPPLDSPNQDYVDEHWIDGFQSEIPSRILYDKLTSLHEIIRKNIGVEPRSHRAGRWAIDKRTFGFLEEFHYKVDSSMTYKFPQIHMKGVNEYIQDNKGKCPLNAYFPSKKDLNKKTGKDLYSVLEVPVPLLRNGSVVHRNNFPFKKNVLSFASKIGKRFEEPVLFRPTYNFSLTDYEGYLRSLFLRKDMIFFTMMFHSNELTEGTSPASKTAKRTENLINRFSKTLEVASELGLKPLFLHETADQFKFG